MATKTNSDPFAAVREAGTSAPNFDLDNDEIIVRLAKWRSLCSFNVKSAEGTLGLQRAVLGKGARSVLVSLWNVSDEATLFLIQRFYHHWLHDANAPTKSEALRLAQADVRAEAAKTRAHRAWADPFYWEILNEFAT